MGYLVLKKPTYFATHGQFTFSPIEKENNLSSQFSLYSFLISFQTLFVPCPGKQINSFHPAGEDKEGAEGFLSTHPLLVTHFFHFLPPPGSFSPTHFNTIPLLTYVFSNLQNKYILPYVALHLVLALKNHHGGFRRQDPEFRFIW